MNVKNKYDKIDAALSEAYFASPKTRPHQELRYKQSRKSQLRKLPSISSRALKICLISGLIIAVMSAIIFGALYFLRDKKIFFTVVDTSAPGSPSTKTIPIALPSQYDIKDIFETNSNENYLSLFDFEDDTNGWEIPLWALDKHDHVAVKCSHTKGISFSNKGSLRLDVDFPGNMWSAAYIEIQQDMDLSDLKGIAASIFIPSSCGRGLRAKFILTVKDSWDFVEMARSTPLIPGKWNILYGDISEGSTLWKRTVVNEEFRKNIRKIGLRIETSNKPVYSGPVYIDSIRGILDKDN